MTKRNLEAAAVFVAVPAGSGVRLKSRLRRYSVSLRGECRNGAALRAFGDLTFVFAVRPGIDLARPKNARATRRPLVCLPRNLSARRLGLLLAALDRQQQMPLPRVGLLLLRRTRLRPRFRRRRFGRVGEAALERIHEVDDLGRRL